MASATTLNVACRLTSNSNTSLSKLPIKSTSVNTTEVSSSETTICRVKYRCSVFKCVMRMKQREPQRKTRSTNAAGIFEKWCLFGSAAYTPVKRFVARHDGLR